MTSVNGAGMRRSQACLWASMSTVASVWKCTGVVLAEYENVAQDRRLLGRQLAAFRKALGIRQVDLAPLVSYTRSTVANAETGIQKVPRGFWQRCDQVLNTGGVLTVGYDRLRAADGAQRAAEARAMSVHLDGVGRRRRTSDSHLSTKIDVVNGSEPEEDSSTASLITGLTQLAAEPSDCEDHIDDNWLAVLPLPCAVEFLLKLSLKLDDERGGDALFAPLSQFVASAAPVVKDDASGSDLSAFAQLSQMTGWLALDAQRHGAARRYLNTAVYAAHEADEPGLAASALAYMSLQDTYRGRVNSALSLARTAYEIGSGYATPLTQTMLATRLARAYATAGRNSASQHMLDKANLAFSKAGTVPEPLWMSYVDRAEVAAQAGACYLELRRTVEARQALLQAVSTIEEMTPHRLRDRVHYLVRLAECDLLDQEVEAACQKAAQAVHLASTIGSTRVTSRIRMFHDQLEPFGGNRAAVEFRELFAAEVAGKR